MAGHLPTRLRSAVGRWPYAAQVSAFSLLLTLLLAACLSRGPVPGDGSTYAQMAAHPTVFACGVVDAPCGPWGYRLLTPWLVHVLPLPRLFGFWLITVLSLTGAATALGLLCRATGLSPRAGLGAAGLFLLSYASTFDLYDYRRIDPLAYCAMAFVLLCLARRQFMLAGACILVATLDKECGLFLLPIFVLALLRERARDARYRLTAFCLGVLLPIMAYWIVRHWPGFGNGALERFYGEQSTWSIVGFIRANMVAAHSTLVAALVNALGALWLVAVLGWNRARPIMFLSLLLIPPVFAQLLFATDWERMLAYATLPVIPFVVAALEALPPRRWYACIALLGASESVGLTLLLGASASLPPWALVAGDLPLVAVLSVAIIVLAAPWTRRHAVCT